MKKLFVISMLLALLVPFTSFSIAKAFVGNELQGSKKANAHFGLTQSPHFFAYFDIVDCEDFEQDETDTKKADKYLSPFLKQYFSISQQALSIAGCIQSTQFFFHFSHVSFLYLRVLRI